MEVYPVLHFIIRFLFYFDVTCPYIYLNIIHLVRTKLYLKHSLPCLVLAHAEKGNYVVLKIGMFDPHPMYSTDFYGISLWLILIKHTSNQLM